MNLKKIFNKTYNKIAIKIYKIMIKANKKMDFLVYFDLTFKIIKVLRNQMLKLL